MQRIENIEEIIVNNISDYLLIGIRRKNEEDEILEKKKKKDKAKIGTITLTYANYYGNEEEEKAEAFIEFLSVFNLWNKVTFNDFDNLFKEELNGRRDK